MKIKMKKQIHIKQGDFNPNSEMIKKSIQEFLDSGGKIKKINPDMMECLEDHYNYHYNADYYLIGR